MLLWSRCMNDSAIVVFTARGLETLLSEGGSQSWVLNQNRAKNCKYLVCVQNRSPADDYDHDWGKVSDPHKNAFFIGLIEDVVESPEWDGSKPTRWLIKVSKYAETAYPNMWDGSRNPVAYTTLSELGINEQDLNFKLMPFVEIPAPNITNKNKKNEDGISISQAKILLAKKYDVSEDNIEIIIRA